MAQRVGVISPCGWGNLGDAAIVAATLEAVRARTPSADLFAVTLNPRDTERRHGIPAYALRASRYGRADSRAAAHRAAPRGPTWWLGVLKGGYRVRHLVANLRNELRHAVAAFRLARRADLLIVAGGGQLDDYWGGAWGHPFNLLKWSIAARLAGTPIVVLSVGYGTSPSRLSRLFLRAALRLCSYCSFRDERTAASVRDRLGVKDPVVVPDLAFGLAVRQPAALRDGGRPVVGVSPIAFADPRSWPVKDRDLYERYLDVLTEFVDWVGSEGHDLILFCTDNMDLKCLRDLQARGTAAHACLESDAARPEPYYKDVDDLMAQLARVDLVVASRLHGVILAHRMAKPVLAVSYDWKVDAQMVQAGESDHLLDIRTLTPSGLAAGFRRLAGQRAETQARLRRKATENARRIDAQFDRIAAQYLQARSNG
jgi:polysaccharide pyruvyl transferase WcaK-like protein